MLKNCAMGLDRAEIRPLRMGDNTEPEKNFRGVCNLNSMKMVTSVSERYILG